VPSVTDPAPCYFCGQPSQTEVSQRVANKITMEVTNRELPVCATGAHRPVYYGR